MPPKRTALTLEQRSEVIRKSEKEKQLNKWESVEHRLIMSLKEKLTYQRTMKTTRDLSANVNLKIQQTKIVHIHVLY